eukprot:GGOE01020902.1.p1 GENE.GGOE01020902.1~~GGOE01020902.1.p1  ORF type:complete len:308 (+),score=64.62 GGOE01020902.1:149-1072(+)
MWPSSVLASELCSGKTQLLVADSEKSMLPNVSLSMHEIVVSRQADAHDGVISWNQLVQEGLPTGTKAVIQLAGQSILKLPRWTEAHKEEVLQSRLHTAGMLIGAMRKAPPVVYLVASAVGFYRSNTVEAQTEEEGVAGDDFPARVCQAVEELAQTASPWVERVVRLRIGVVLSKAGGALQQMWMPFSCGLGGVIGPGTQPFPWIHMVDAVGLFKHALTAPDINGPLNVVAPGRCTNYEFTKALGKVLWRPTILPVPAFVLHLVLGEESEMLLDGQNVAAEKALTTGYVFQFPTIEDALSDIRDNSTL